MLHSAVCTPCVQLELFLCLPAAGAGSFPFLSALPLLELLLLDNSWSSSDDASESSERGRSLDDEGCWPLGSERDGEIWRCLDLVWGAEI